MVILSGRRVSIVGGAFVSLSFLLAPLFFLWHIGDVPNKIPVLAFCALFLAAGIFLGKVWLDFFQQDLYRSEAKRVYPDEPWKWRKDWADRKILSSPGTLGRVGMGFAFLGNVFVVFLIALLLDESKLSQKAREMIELRYGFSILLALLGAYLFLRAYFHWRTTKSFLGAVLTFDTLPVPTGSSFSLQVEVDPTMRFDGEIVARIGCTEIERGSGVIGNPRTDLWTEERAVRQDGAYVSIDGVELPTDLPFTTIGYNAIDIEWWIALIGTVNKEQVVLNFNLPVFQNKG